MVTSVAEEAARTEEDPAVTFARIHALAAAMDGRPVPAPPVDAIGNDSHVSRAAPPRLSEPWFCCAQPTKMQLGSSCRQNPSGDR